MRFIPLLAGLSLVLPSFAQTGVTTTNITSSGNAVQGRAHFSPRPFAGMVVAGAAYSAQRVSEHVQIAADGTRFTTTNQQETVYRDSQGRTRTERRLIMGPDFADSPLLVEISDPVANVGYTLDTQNKMAHRYTYTAPPGRQMATGGMGMGGGGFGTRAGVLGGSVPPPPPGSGAPPAQMAIRAEVAGTGMVTAAGTVTAGLPRPEMTREDLPAQIIEGVMAKGQRMIQHWPAGSQGSDRPFQTTSEIWNSDELKLVVLSKNVDPRNGENTMKLLNINRAEPDSTLFAPPPDFTVVDETGPFEIQWTGTRHQ